MNDERDLRFVGCWVLGNGGERRWISIWVAVVFFFFKITGGDFVDLVLLLCCIVIDLVWCLYGYGFVLDVLQFSRKNVF